MSNDYKHSDENFNLAIANFIAKEDKAVVLEFFAHQLISNSPLSVREKPARITIEGVGEVLITRTDLKGNTSLTGGINIH